MQNGKIKNNRSMTKNNNTLKIELCQDQEVIKKIKYKYQKTVNQGTVIDVTRLSYAPRCPIKVISKTEYLKLNVPVRDRYGNIQSYTSDGEVHEVMPIEKQSGEQMRNRRSLRKIFVDLRQLIQVNFGDNQGKNKNTQFLTLTYEGAKQTKDPKVIQLDFKNFWLRFSRMFPSYELGYVAIVEPHASGMFHIHMLLKSLNGTELAFQGAELYNIWRNGYVTVEDIISDHIGAYFIAYFSNLEILPEDEIKELENQGDIKEKDGKKYVKGKRLDMYPDGMQIYRYSRNLKKPKVEKGAKEIDETEYNKSYEATYKMTTVFENGDEKENFINKQQYKKGRKNV